MLRSLALGTAILFCLAGPSFGKQVDAFLKLSDNGQVKNPQECAAKGGTVVMKDGQSMCRIPAPKMQPANSVGTPTPRP